MLYNSSIIKLLMINVTKNLYSLIQRKNLGNKMERNIKTKKDKEHYNTYSSFINLMIATAVTVAVILILMAIFLL